MSSSWRIYVFSAGFSPSRFRIKLACNVDFHYVHGVDAPVISSRHLKLDLLKFCRIVHVGMFNWLIELLYFTFVRAQLA